MADTNFESDFESTADTIRHSVSGIAEDMSEKFGDAIGEAQRLLKEYPAAALIGAVVVGFAAGRLLRRG